MPKLPMLPAAAVDAAAALDVTADGADAPEAAVAVTIAVTVTAV